MAAGHLKITVHPEWWLQIVYPHMMRLANRGWHPVWADAALTWVRREGLRLRPSEHTSRYNRRKEVL